MSDSRNNTKPNEQIKEESKNQTTSNQTTDSANVGGHSTDGKSVNKAHPVQWATCKNMGNPTANYGADHTTSGHEKWEDKKIKLKVKFPNLTDTDLHFEVGKKEEMLTRIQSKIGKTKSELDTIIEGL